MGEVEVHHAGIEEGEGNHKGEHRADGDNLERDVALGAHYLFGASALALHLAGSKADGTLDDAPALDDAYHASHGDATDTDGTAVGLEDGFGCHFTHRSDNIGVPLVEDGVGEKQGHTRNNKPPHGKRTEADDGGIAQTDDVAQTEDGSTGVDLEDELGMVGKLLTPCHYTRGEVLVPQTKGGDDEVVESTDETSHEQGLGLAASLGTRHEHLGGGSGFGEGIFAVHILDEILAERYEEEDAEDTTQRRSDEYAQEVGLEVKHIDGGHHKDGSGYHSARTGSDALDDNILAHGVAALGGRR